MRARNPKPTFNEQNKVETSAPFNQRKDMVWNSSSHEIMPRCIAAHYSQKHDMKPFFAANVYDSPDY